MEGVDILATPTCPVTAWPIEDGPPTSVDGIPASPRMAVLYTGFANAMGWPGISLPCGLAPDGLPVGLQLVAPYGEDRRVLALAEAFQDATAWHTERPGRE